MAITGQQKQVLQILAQQSGDRSWKDMAAENPHIPKASFRRQLDFLRDEGLAESTTDDKLHWVITEKGIEVAGGPAGKITKADVGLTERQIFEEKGRIIGTIPPDKLSVITDHVWTQDPHDLDWVWHALGEMNVPVDTKRAWCASWRGYLHTSGLPAEFSPQLKQVIEATAPETKAEKPPTLGRDYRIENGEIIRVGEGIGDFTLPDAKEVLAIQNLGKRAAALTATQPDVTKDTVSSLIQALTPLLSKDTNTDMLKELLTAQMSNMELQLLAKIPQQTEQKTIGDQVTGIVETLKALGSAGPTIKALLGIPEATTVPQQAPQTPIQLQNPDGTPVVLDLNSFIAIKKFESEQKREEAEEKRKEDMSSSVRKFMERIGEAAVRSSGGE